MKNTIASIIATARHLGLFATGESKGEGSFGTFGTAGVTTPEQALALQDKWGSRSVHPDKAARLRADAGLGADYDVTHYVAAALNGSKVRPSAYAVAGVAPYGVDQSQPRDGVETREVATLTATITDAPDAYVNSGENVRILANAAAGIYRYHTANGLSLDARIVGTKLTIRELGAIARAIGVHV
jgi:hypothetical protein